MTFIQTSCTLSDYTHISGTAVMEPDAEKCTDNDQYPFRKDDKATCRGTFMHNKTHAIKDCQCEVKIIDAGQIDDLCK